MKRIITILLFAFSGVTMLWANTTGVVREDSVQTDKDKSPVFEGVEEEPQFPGGDQAVFDYLNNNINYPQISKENGSQGNVFVGFVIDTNGEVTDVKVIRGVDPYIDKEACRVVASMPRWIPGKQNGKAVRVWYRLRVQFRIQ